MGTRRAQLGGVHAGGSSGATIVHLDLPAAASGRVPVPAREPRAEQIERAMALADGARVRLPGGTIAYAAHRLVRDGARVALITIPDVLRFDVHPRADTFSFNVRNLNGLPVRDNAHELPVRPYHRLDGPPLNEYELQLKTPEGYDVCIVVRVPPYFGALEHEYSAVALLS
ncbi:MAG: hypothetical protein QOJ46_1199 [bacterium]